LGIKIYKREKPRQMSSLLREFQKNNLESFKMKNRGEEFVRV